MCKVCERSFKGHGGLMRHIGHSASCKGGYGDEFEDMKRTTKKAIQVSGGSIPQI